MNNPRHNHLMLLMLLDKSDERTKDIIKEDCKYRVTLKVWFVGDKDWTVYQYWIHEAYAGGKLNRFGYTSEIGEKILRDIEECIKDGSLKTSFWRQTYDKENAFAFNPTHAKKFEVNVVLEDFKNV